MSRLTEILIFFVTLGFVEAVVKPVAIRYTRWSLVKAFPSVVDTLDPVMPDLIRSKTSAELEQIVRDVLSDKTGEDWQSKNIDSFWSMYDIRAAADKAKNFG